MVNVMYVISGEEILERVFKKFGKWGIGMYSSFDVYGDEDGDEILEIDGWEVYIERIFDESCELFLYLVCMCFNCVIVVKFLLEFSLFKICIFYCEGIVI